MSDITHILFSGVVILVMAPFWMHLGWEFLSRPKDKGEKNER